MVEREFEAIAQAMQAAGLPPHVEPTDCEDWCANGYGYSGLHALGEVAGLIWQGRPIPRATLLTGEDTPAEMALFNAHWARLMGKPARGWLARLFPAKAKPENLPFAHLSLHPDGTGYYVPTPFATPICPSPLPPETEDIWPLGSVQKLQEELAILAEALEVPPLLHSESDEVLEFLDEPNDGRITDGPLWQAQPIATWSLLILREACTHSLKTGAAIHFG